MCLGVPGQVVRVDENPLGVTMGRVDFGGITKEICLAYVPDVEVGEFVLVHVGFAISKMDEEEARETLRILRQLAEATEPEAPGSDRGAAAGPDRS